MKNFVLILAILFTSYFDLLAQNQENKLLIEEYVKQSENQKKTGLIMLGTGVGATVLGTVMIGVAWSGSSEAAGWTGVVLFTAGAVSTLASIPIIISSASKARKAAHLSIQSRSLPGIQPTGISAVIYPELNLSIPLNSK